MKKTTIMILAAGVLFVSGLKAQSIQEGMNDLYAGRAKSAIGVFEKLLSVNPNNIEASYWLGQSYLDADEIAGSRISEARKVYEKAMQATNNAPLIMVGLGHVELLENKIADSKQHFETALTMTRNPKKGDDPVIATAIGRAIADSKTGDFKYAVQLLEGATAKDPKNTETLLQLGNAYRKAGEGNGGGQAFQTYKKALEVNPSFAVASLRLAKLFESQKNWELVLQYLNESVQKDPKFTNGYYELFYYYFYRSKFEEAEDQLKKYIDSKLPDNDIQDQYLYAQLCWAKRDFDCAISKAESVVTAMGNNTKPKVYRLLADAYFNKGDYTGAKRYSDLFFAKKNPEDPILNDYKLRADILAKTGGTDEEIMDTYVKGADVDSVISSKVDFLKQAAAYFKTKKIRDKESILLEKIIALKPKPSINDYFDLTLSQYFSQNYGKSREVALKMIDLFPDQVYGYEWSYNNAIAVDTVKKDSIAVPDALKLYGFSQKDTSKFKKQYINSVRFLAAYYINVAKDKDKSLEFFNKWLEADPASSSTILPIIEQIKKMQVRPPAATPKGNAPPAKTTEAKTPPAGTSKTTAKTKTTTVAKKSTAKK